MDGGGRSEGRGNPTRAEVKRSPTPAPPLRAGSHDILYNDQGPAYGLPSVMASSPAGAAAAGVAASVLTSGLGEAWSGLPTFTYVFWAGVEGDPMACGERVQGGRRGTWGGRGATWAKLCWGP